MRFVVLFVCFFTTLAHSAEDDLMIARQALALSRHSLSTDPDNADGLVWFKLAKAISPESRDVRELSTQLANERVLPPPAAPKLNDEALIDALIDRADVVIKKTFKNEVQVGYLANLYLRVAERKKNSDLTLRKHLASLETYGIRESLQNAFARDYKLLDAEKVGTKAVVQPVHPLAKNDDAIAYECIRIASRLLGKDPKSELGKLWLNLGLHLRPDLITAIVIRDQVVLGIPVKPLAGGVSNEKLVATMLDRAEYHQTKAKKSKVSAHLGLLFYRMVERLDPTNRYALLGIVRLEKDGSDASLGDLLGGQSLAAVAGLEQLKIPDYATKSNPVTVIPKPGPDETKGNDSTDPVNWDKVNASGRLKKRDVMIDEFDKVESVSFEGIVENKTDTLVTGATVERLLIGKNKNGKALFIAKRLGSPIAELKGGESVQLPKISAEFGGGCRYFTWLIAIKNANGRVVKLQSLSSLVQNAADKIIKFPVSSHYYNGTYGNEESFFTTSGEPFTK